MTQNLAFASFSERIGDLLVTQRISHDTHEAEMGLTKRQIDGEKYTGNGVNRPVIWDDNPRGLGLRIYPTGRKVFVLSYRDSGNVKRLATIGDYGVFTLEQAQDSAKALLRTNETGADALAVRRANKAAPSFGDLAKDYASDHAPTKKTGAEDLRRIARHLNGWDTRKLAGITRADVQTLIRGIVKAAPYEANRTLSLLSKMFNLANDWDLLPAGHQNPCQNIKRAKERKRERWVTPAELPAIAQAIDAEPSPYARAALWLYLLTGCRKTELLSARWSFVDFTRSVLCLPETKTGNSHEIPLTAPALAILETLPKLSGNPFVFPGLVAGRPLESIRGPFERVRTAAGCADVRLHDLRRTVGSWMAQSGNSLALIGKVLNHTNQSTTAIYARFSQDSVRAALEAHATQILSAAGKLPTASVTDISTARRVKA